MLKWLGNLVDSNEKEIKRLQPLVAEINALEPEFQKLSDEQLKEKSAAFKARLAESTAELRQELAETQTELKEARASLPTLSDDIERSGKENECKQLETDIAAIEKEIRENESDILNELLPEAFATAREAARRTIGQRHYDAQMMGGIVLNGYSYYQPQNRLWAYIIGTLASIAISWFLSITIKSIANLSDNAFWITWLISFILAEIIAILLVNASSFKRTDYAGKIAEMRTGEGKTLVATLPLYLNALTGRGVHLVTVNDYLSKRDAQWMGPIYHALGITTATIQHEASFIYDPSYESEDKRWPRLRPVSRKEAYQADITYGTNNEFGFDYLRDNMVIELDQCAQRQLNYAIVDEVDNILIDEARTPLIISGHREESLQEYQIFARIAAGLRPGTDYKMSEKGRSIDEITESGYDNAERILKREGILKTGNLYDNATLVHHLRNAITAKEAYQENKEYVKVKDKDGSEHIVIVDEFTGRLMPGRRYSEGLHQAIEAKAKVKVQHESMTYATVTFQNYFRMYAKLAGMTGTALTEAEEFHKIYKLEVVVIPTNRTMVRKDDSDRIYKDEASKFKAVVNEVAELHKKRQPVLIGTVSIEKSEILSEMMKRKGIQHQVLNAKLHEKEASIIREAGKLAAVTIATNMAGRGVDIVLGGDPEGRDQKDWQQEHDKVVGLGGLFVLGTERHEARRIDNQLRGRSGRQGDPGESRFYVSLEDDIMKRFGGDRIKWIMDKAGFDEDTPIENKLISRSIEGAQVRVEGYHFDIRKQLVEFDDVVNKQRELIYTERRKILSGADLKANILAMVKEEISHLAIARAGDEYGEGRDIKGLLADVSAIMPLPKELNAEALASLKPEEVAQKLTEQAQALYEQREKEIGAEAARALEKLIMLRTIDNLWIEHLTEMDHQRLQAGWAGLQQQKAVDVYKNLGAEQWQNLTEDIRRSVATMVFHINIVRQETVKPAPTPMAKLASNTPARPQAPRQIQGIQPQGTSVKKVGRNDPCPCGSGKKYKHCHGQ